MRVFITLFIAFFNCFLCLSEELSIPSCKVSISDKIIRNNQYSCKLKIAAPDGWKFPQPPNISIKNSSDFVDIKKEVSCSGKRECIFSISARSPQPRIMKLSIDSPICDKVCVLTNNCVDIDFGERNLLFLYIILGFFGGLILNVMPCVLPVILMKLRAFKSKIGLVGSICGNFASFFVVIAGLVGLKSAGTLAGWGMHFQSTSFLAVTAVVLFALTLYSFGIFHLNLSMTVKYSAKSIFWKNFISSTIATFVAIPCTAPFLGTAAAFAIQGTMFQLVCVFLAIATGFSFPYIFMLVFPLKIPDISGKIINIFDKIIGCGVLITFLWISWLLAQNLTAQETNFEHTYKNVQADIANNRIVMMNITADWCLTCKYNRRYVLNSEKVKEAIAKNNVKFVEIDITKKDDSVTQFLHEHKRVGIPFTIIYGPNAKDGVLLDETPSIEQVIRAIEKIK